MSPTDTDTSVDTTTIVNPNKRLSGQAKQYLDDIAALNEKTTQEMMRGIRDGYLDRDGAVELAEKIGVEPPKVKRRFTRYFTRTEVYRLEVDAYDEGQASQEVERMHQFNVTYGDIHYGSRIRVGQDDSRMRAVISPTVTEYPTVESIGVQVHPWQTEWHRWMTTGERTPYDAQRELERRLNHNSFVPGDRY